MENTDDPLSNLIGQDMCHGPDDERVQVLGVDRRPDGGPFATVRRVDDGTIFDIATDQLRPIR
jgi:hypothetical protein